jgi:hypothetical protein
VERVNEIIENRLGISGSPHGQNGFIFGAAGEIYNLLEAKTHGHLPIQGDEGSWPVIIPEMQTGRAYSLSYTENSSWIYVYDLERQLVIDRRKALGLQGVPTKLIRWGEDGFGFRTSWDELFILRNDLPPSGPATDLELSFSAATGKLNSAGKENLKFQIAKIGGTTATNVILTVNPATGTLQFQSIPARAIVMNPAQVQIPTLLAGQTAAFEASYTSSDTSSAVEGITASITTSTADHTPSNDRASVYLARSEKLQSGRFIGLPLFAKSAASDGTNVYVTILDTDSFGGNSLMRIDLVNGVIQRRFGSGPSLLKSPFLRIVEPLSLPSTGPAPSGV